MRTSFGILSTFPPTSCGIATFSAALAAGLIAHGASVDVVRCSPSPQLEDALVLASLNDGSPSSLAAAIDVLNATDVVPQSDPVTLGAAIRSVLTDPDLASSMAAEARRLAPELSWVKVARRYGELADRLIAERAAVSS